jgi:DNA-binding transcriptional regulator GbsR (MarR family)
MLCENPVDSQTISEELNISRGNTSMCLKELRNWGVIQKFNISGDRRDFFAAEADTWNMLYKIAVNRKNREFDPALEALQRLLKTKDIKKNKRVHERLSEIEDILMTLNQIASKFLENENKSKTILGFFKNFGPK